MNNIENTIEVRSKRTDSRYYIDNEFLNGYAAKVGPNGHIVYSALCRHEKDGKAFPGYRHLAKELGTSVGNISSGVKKLKKYNIIKIEKSNRKNKSYTYWLVDYKNWSDSKNKSDWFNQKSSIISCSNSEHQKSRVQIVNSSCSNSEQNNTNINNRSISNKLEIDSEQAQSGEDENKELFNTRKYIAEKMITDKKRYIQLIGKYFITRKLDFKSKNALQEAIKRHLRAAIKVSNFTDEEIKAAARMCKRKYFNIDWTMDTILKILTSTNVLDQE